MAGQHAAEAFVEQLQVLAKSGHPHFLEGGQAVNVWAEVYSPRVPALAELSPFTSKDCDVWASYGLFQALEHDQLLPGKLIKSDSPLDGQLGILQLQAPPRIIDFLQSVYGLNESELQRATRRMLVVSGVHVLDPLYLFKGKCHNFIDLDQAGRQDRRHLEILKLVIPMHLDSALEQACKNTISERDLINEIKLLLNFKKDSRVREALVKQDCTLFDLLPVGRLARCRLAKVEHFAFTQLGN